MEFTKPRYCIAGPNGCGKTTLLMMAAGLETPTHGKVCYHGFETTIPEHKQDIGISSDKIALPEFLSAKQLIAFHCAQFEKDIDESLIENLSFKKQLPQKSADLSLGNQKKLSLLLALMHQPKLLLLDEPTVGLDEKSRLWLLDYITNFDGQIIVTSHEPIFLQDPQFEHISMQQINNQR